VTPHGPVRDAAPVAAMPPAPFRDLDLHEPRRVRRIRIPARQAELAGPIRPGAVREPDSPRIDRASRRPACAALLAVLDAIPERGDRGRDPWRRARPAWRSRNEQGESRRDEGERANRSISLSGCRASSSTARLAARSLSSPGPHVTALSARQQEKRVGKVPGNRMDTGTARFRIRYGMVSCKQAR
jgi:hypothetical protein